MGWGSVESQLPPMLMMGDAISFRDGEHLACHLETELRHGRLMAIDLAGVELHAPRTFLVQVRGAPGTVSVKGVAVHRQGDVVGLQLECDPTVMRSLDDLLGVVGRPPRRSAETPVAGPPAGGGALLAPTPPPEPKRGPIWAEPTDVLGPDDLGLSAVEQTPAPAAPPLLEPFHPSGSFEVGAGLQELDRSVRDSWNVDPFADVMGSTSHVPETGLLDESVNLADAKPPVLAEAPPEPPAGAPPAPPPEVAPEPPTPRKPTRRESGERLPPPPSASEIDDMGGLLLDAPPEPQPEPAAAPEPTPPPSPEPAGSSESAAPPDAPAVERLPVIQGTLRHITGPMDLARAFGTPTLFSLMRELQRACRAGRLTLLLPRGPVGLSLDRRGCVCDFDANLAAALVEESLLDRNTAAAVGRFPGAMTQAHALLAGGAPGVIPPPVNTLRASLRVLLRDLLLDIASQRDIRYFFDPNERARSVRELRLPFLDYGRAWLHHVLHQMLRLDELEKHFGPRKESYPVVPDDARWQPLMLSLDRAEARFVKDTLPKGKSLRDLLTFSPLSRIGSYRLMIELQALDMLRFDTEEPDFAVAANIEESVSRRLAQGRHSHFAALGVHLTAHHSEYEGAMNRIERRYGPSGRMAQHSRRAAQLCKQVVEQARAGFVFLQPRRQRIEYRRGLHTPTELIGMAELLAGKVKLASFRGNDKLAREMLEVARELDPSVRP